MQQAPWLVSLAHIQYTESCWTRRCLLDCDSIEKSDSCFGIYSPCSSHKMAMLSHRPMCSWRNRRCLVCTAPNMFPFAALINSWTNEKWAIAQSFAQNASDLRNLCALPIATTIRFTWFNEFFCVYLARNVRQQCQAIFPGARALEHIRLRSPIMVLAFINVCRSQK